MAILLRLASLSSMRDSWSGLCQGGGASGVGAGPNRGGRVVCPVSDRRVRVMQREPVDRETEARAGPWVLRVGVTLRTRLFAPRPAPHFTDGEAEAEGWHLGEAKHVLQGPGLPALLGFEPEAVPRTGSRGQTIGAACAPRPPGSHHGCRFLTPEVAPPHRERPCPWTWQEAPGGTPRCGDWGGGVTTHWGLL